MQKIKYIAWLGVLNFLNMILSLNEEKKQVRAAATELSLLTLAQSYQLIKDS